MVTRRVLAVGFSGKLGSALLALPALGIARGRMGVPGAFWGLAGSAPDGSPVPEVLIAGAGFEGFLRLPPRRALTRLLGLVIQLRQLGFRDAVYVGPAKATARALWKVKLLLRLGGVRCFIGFQALPAAASDPFELHRNQALLRMDRLAPEGLNAGRPALMPPLPWLSVPEKVRAKTLRWLQSHPGRTGRHLVALCPGAALAANRWPLERFVEIGRRLIDTGAFDLLVCGGPGDAQAGNQMVAAWGQGIQAAGRFPIMASAALLGECRFVLGLDTGTTHLAAALGVRCVVLQGGRVPPGSWDPPGEGHVLLRHPVNCAGCRKAVCPIKAHPCMRGLTVDLAWEGILSFLGSPSGSAGRP